ncbi:hypothetical protein C4Q27_01375 [Pseudomonas sp. SWI36]|nr:hypothetical protein C4Q27_01375 [Pseudomonas sp. SWI36]
MERKAVSGTLRCLKCGGQDLVTPIKLNKKAILTCRRCGAIANYGDLMQAEGRRLIADIRQRLPLLEVN